MPVQYIPMGMHVRKGIARLSVCACRTSRADTTEWAELCVCVRARARGGGLACTRVANTFCTAAQ